MTEFLEKYRDIIVAILLAFLFSISLLTMVNDSAIVDEIAHIPAGYSYVAFGDYRLNPEHPPLLKDLAGLPLLLFPLSFPSNIPAWTTDTNGQWESGWNFIYHYGNNPDLILFFSRLPILLLAVVFGFVIYLFVRREFGTNAALLSLFFYAMSPNFLAHNHFVTTDLGIAFFIFLSIATFAAFLKSPSWKNLIYATLALAGAELAKFSAVLLIPFFGLAVIAYIWASKIAPKMKLVGMDKIKSKLLKKAWFYLASYGVMLIGVGVLIWIFYALHVINFPAEKQIELIKVSIPDDRVASVRNLLVSMSGNKFFQPLAHYLLGVTMVFARVAGGNTTFFLGQVSNQSFKWYFPISYLLKEQVPFLFLLLTTILYTISRFFETRFSRWLAGFKKFIAEQPLTLLFLAFTFYYGGISVAGNLNLGIRHLFPILSLIYILVAVASIKFFASIKSRPAKTIGWTVLSVLVLWYAVTPIVTFPHYVSYFNEIIGGGQNGYRYFTDSNVDWGQDLKRLAAWTRQHPEIEKLKLDYFGGGEPKYYFCKRAYDQAGRLIKSASGYDCTGSVYQEWHTKSGPTTGWIAVSVTFLQNAKYYAEKFGEPDYDWLRDREPYAKIGNSIFVYWIR